jgi:hypothetical protein
MSAQDKLAAQTYISSPHNFYSSFVKRGGYALQPILPTSKVQVKPKIPTLEERNSFAPVSGRRNRPSRVSLKQTQK